MWRGRLRPSDATCANLPWPRATRHSPTAPTDTDLQPGTPLLSPSAWLMTLLLGLPCALLLLAPWLCWRFVRAVPQLRELPYEPLPSWPAVSILVPARDEQHSLREASLSRLALDYPDLQLVLVNDRSEDDTGAIVDELAAADERVTAVHVTRLPPDWLGKNHALKLASEAARGEWLLFSDADVHFAPDVLRRALAHAEARGLDFMTLIPDMWSTGFWQDCALAAFGRLFTLTQRPWRMQDPQSEAAMGVGAFNLVRRSALDASEGLQWLAYDVVDDVALARLLKRSGARCAAVSGRGLAGLRWYDSLPAMVRGLEKNTFASCGCSLPRLLFYATLVLWMELSPFAALFAPVPAWLPWLAGAGLLVGGGCSAVMARFMGRPVLPSLLTPVGTLLMAYTLARAGWLGWRRGGVVWRDTFYPSEKLRQRARVRF